MLERCSTKEGVGTVLLGNGAGWECEKRGEFGVNFDLNDTIFVASGRWEGYFQPVQSVEWSLS